MIFARLIVVTSTGIEGSSFVDVSIETSTITRSIKRNSADCSSDYSLYTVTETNLSGSVLKDGISGIAFIRALVRGLARISGTGDIARTSTREHVT